MKHKVGDKVVVRKDLDLDKRYAMEHNKDISNSITEKMVELAGKTVTIACKRLSISQYLILEDEGEWDWTDEMFESEE